MTTWRRSERRHAVRELAEAAARTIGYIAVSGLVVWLAFTYVP